jgi:hypothetical protein
MGTPNEEERFMTNIKDLTDLIHELITTCYESGIKDINPMLVGLASSYISSLDKKELIETFIEHTHEECWEKIRLKEEEFFVNHTDKIFGNLPVGKNHIDAFKILFTSKDKDGEYIIIEDDREAIFDIFRSLVKICIKYVHRVRECYLLEKDGKMVPRYRYEKFPKIKIREHAKKWKIVLPMPQV